MKFSASHKPYPAIEVIVRQGDTGVTLGFNDDELKKLLTVYEKKRPKRVKVE